MAFTATAFGGLASAYFILRTPNLVHHLAWHAELATALGPVTGVLSLFAVVAALWSVELQRRSLAGAKEDFATHMEQLQRTAIAQEKLADAQLQLLATQQSFANKAVRAADRANDTAERAVIGQNEANTLARQALKRSLETELAAHWATASAILAETINVTVAAETGHGGTAVIQPVRDRLEREREVLSAQMHRETNEIFKLEARLKDWRDEP